MSYDDVEIEDMDFDPAEGMFTYPCPCGDLFQVSIGIHLSLSLSLSRVFRGLTCTAISSLFLQITIEDLETGEEIARCPSCSLFITVIYDDETIQSYKSQMKS